MKSKSKPEPSDHSPSSGPPDAQMDVTVFAWGGSILWPLVLRCGVVWHSEKDPACQQTIEVGVGQVLNPRVKQKPLRSGASARSRLRRLFWDRQGCEPETRLLWFPWGASEWCTDSDCLEILLQSIHSVFLCFDHQLRAIQSYNIQLKADSRDDMFETRTKTTAGRVLDIWGGKCSFLGSLWSAA